ncbi:tetratricopeptide repeat protein, partial [bacterium]
MSVSSKPRKRAVRLTPEALESLRAALTERWRSQSSGRLTREARAELLGVSIATAEKIIANRGVDRTTLEVAFNSLGLEWNDAFCEYASAAAEVSPVRPAESDERGSAHRVPLVASVPPQTTPIRNLVAAGLLTAALLGGAAIVAWRSGVAAPPKPTVSSDTAWIDESDRALVEASARYHRSDFQGARKELGKVLEIAREHDSNRNFDAASLLLGDLETLAGRFEEAKDQYAVAIRRRKNLGQKPWPPVLESVGMAEMRLHNWQAARESLILCLEGFRDNQEPVGVAMASRDLGELAFRTGDLDAAENWFRRSLATIKGLRKADIETDVRGQHALVHLARGHALRAREELKACLDYWSRWESKGHPRWIAVTEMRLGLTEARLKNTAAARAHFTRSKEGFQRVGD